MIEKLPHLGPEIALFVTTMVVMVVGLSPNYRVRRLSALIAGIGIGAAGVLAAAGPTLDTSPFPGMMPFAKVLVAAVGLLVLLLLNGTVDRDLERRVAAGEPYNALRANRAEFYSFFLFSLTGLMLCASADNLIWLFLALELTSLPTYVMVTISTRSTRSQEAGVKYFFLGALGAAIFLYGFTLLYGATGTTSILEIRHALSEQARAGGVSQLALAGLVLAILGVSFKVAAVPMHFYTADVYQGAAAPVSGMLAFVPKAAGFIALIVLVSTVGWRYHIVDGQSVYSGAPGGSLPQTIRVLLWVLAALTMTVGNVLALLQDSTKRILAYSSIAHSGYMLVGVVAGPGEPGGGFTSSGIAAVLFYLFAYGVMNLGAFAVVAGMERRRGQTAEPIELDHVDHLRGLCRTHPLLGWTMVICALSLLGFPLTLGFFAKLPLFTSGIRAGEYVLVIILGINSAIAAVYYLRLAALPLLETSEGPAAQLTPYTSRLVAGALSAAGALALVLVANRFMEESKFAATPAPLPAEMSSAEAGVPLIESASANAG